MAGALRSRDKQGLFADNKKESPKKQRKEKKRQRTECCQDIFKQAKYIMHNKGRVQSLGINVHTNTQQMPDDVTDIVLCPSTEFPFKWIYFLN